MRKIPWFRKKFCCTSWDLIYSTKVENIFGRKKLGTCSWSPRDFFTYSGTCLAGVSYGANSTSSSWYPLLDLCWIQNLILHWMVTVSRGVIQQKKGVWCEILRFWLYSASISCWYLLFDLYWLSSWFGWMQNKILHRMVIVSTAGSSIKRRRFRAKYWDFDGFESVFLADICFWTYFGFLIRSIGCEIKFFIG